MITLYLDMDGVLCNFDKAYRSLRTHATDGKRFRAAVMEYKIFEDLEFMPDTQELLNHVCKLDKEIDIQILTSMGTFDVQQGNEAKRQKQVWLDKWNIPYKANFVRSKEEKSLYAHKFAILIDDSPGCITPFLMKDGQGILHKSSIETISILNKTISGLRAIGAVRMVA
jgi:hypothetical protein